MANWLQLPEKTCVLFGQPLTPEGDMKASEAHVISSALGGRYKPRGILSIRANNVLERRVDGPFTGTFGHALTYLVRVSRDRGKSTDTRIRDSQGKEWVFSFERDAIHPARATIDVTKLDDGSMPFEFSGTAEQLRATLKSMGRLDVLEACLALTTTVSESSPELKLGIRPVKAGHVTLSAWTTVALFAAAKLQIQSLPWQQYVQGTSTDTETAPAVRFSPGAVSFGGDYGALSHGVAIWNDPQRQALYGYVQTFGGMGLIVCFARGWSTDVRASYCVDPLTGSQGEPAFAVAPNGVCFERMEAPPVKADILAMFGRIGDQIRENVPGTVRVIGG